LNQQKIKLITPYDRTHATILAKDAAARRYLDKSAVYTDVWDRKGKVQLVKTVKGMRNESPRTDLLARVDGFIEK
jgi:hypothetical protein